MQNNIPYNLIAKYLSGESNSDDIIALNSWREESIKNENVFQEYREMWIIASSSETPEIPNKEAVWEKLLNQIQKVKPLRLYNRSFIVRAVGVAATIALFIGFSFSYFIPLSFNTKTNLELKLNEVTIRTPSGQKSEITLPDGSAVWLNSGSVLTYNSGYGINNRQVMLKGEAFFDVACDEKKIFEVLAGDIQVQVHGTAFGIQAYLEEESVDVSLLRGHVTVHSASLNRLLADLNPNQKVVIEKNTLLSNIEDCNADIENLWRHGKLKIKGESIAEVAVMMSRWYGVDMSVQGKTSNEKYWFTVKTESLNEMLGLINKITPIDYTINGEEVIIQYR